MQLARLATHEDMLLRIKKLAPARVATMCIAAFLDPRFKNMDWAVGHLNLTDVLWMLQGGESRAPPLALKIPPFALLDIVHGALRWV